MASLRLMTLKKNELNFWARQLYGKKLPMRSLAVSGSTPAEA